MEQSLLWLWIIISIIFFVAEIFTTGFFLVCFGLGAAAAALGAAFGLGLPWQFALFLGVSLLTLFLVRPFANRISGKGQNQVGIDRVLGQQAVVLEEVNPLHARGMVRVAREEWRADSLDGQVIPRGSIVDVVRVEGTRLIVRPTPMRTLSEEKE